MSEQPQPPQRSQEWTPEYVGSLVGEPRAFNGAWAIAQAHNSAIAAIKKKILQKRME